MSCKPCPHHCPNGSGTPLAALGAVLAVVLAVVVGQVVESLFAAIVIVSSVLGAAGVSLFVFLLHRDRRPAIPIRARAARSLPLARRSAAVSAPRLLAIESGPADARHPGSAAGDKVSRDGVPLAIPGSQGS